MAPEARPPARVLRLRRPAASAAERPRTYRAAPCGPLPAGDAAERSAGPAAASRTRGDDAGGRG